MFLCLKKSLKYFILFPDNFLLLFSTLSVLGNSALVVAIPEVFYKCPSVHTERKCNKKQSTCLKK